jgi:hypothetical protein
MISYNQFRISRIIPIYILAIFILLSFGSEGFAQNPSILTVSFQDGVDGYLNTRDSKLMSAKPTTNFGSRNRLSMDGDPDASALIYWDITSIPIGSSIQSVDITFNVSGRSNDDYEIYKMQRPWVESETNWNEFATGQSWQVPGGDGSVDRGSAALGFISATVNGIYTTSLNASGIAMVQSWVDNPGSNHGIIVLDYINASDGLDLSSRETKTVANRPNLTVTYSSSTEPDIMLSSPNGGEQWEVGATQTISWVSSDNPDNVNIEYSSDNGITWQLIAASTPDDGSEPWLIPNTPSNQVLVRVSDINGIISDQSDGVFTIILPPPPDISIDDVSVSEGNTGLVKEILVQWRQFLQ